MPRISETLKFFFDRKFNPSKRQINPFINVPMAPKNQTTIFLSGATVKPSNRKIKNEIRIKEL
jgi:hypothetical protein